MARHRDPNPRWKAKDDASKNAKATDKKPVKIVKKPPPDDKPKK